MSGHTTNFFPHAQKIELYYIYLYLSLEVKAQAYIDMFHTYYLFKDKYCNLHKLNVWFNFFLVFFSLFVIVEGQFLARKYNYFVLIFMLLQ